MRIGIIGAGNVGSSLGKSLALAGHSITYGLRNPEDPKYQKLSEGGAQLAPIPDLVSQVDLLILATPWGAAQSAVESAGDFEGKLLIDATNPIGPGLSLTIGHTDSGGEQIARWAPTARVVKGFNTTGAENMANPDYGTQRPAMFFCGDDSSAVETALELANSIGFEALNVGPLAKTRLLEPAALLWITLAMQRGHGRNIAFGMLRRNQ